MTLIADYFDLSAVFKTLLKQINRNAIEVDATVFGDAIAEKADWSPLKIGGANYAAYILDEKKGALVLKSAPTTMYMMIIPFIMATLLSIVSEQTENPLWMVGSAFMVFLGFSGISEAQKKIVIDKKRGLCWRGKSAKTPSKNQMPLNSAYAIQLLKEKCTSSSSGSSTRRHTYFAYELNFILNTSQRIHIIDTGDYAVAKQQAEKVAEYLGVPLWDSTLGEVK